MHAVVEGHLPMQAAVCNHPVTSLCRWPAVTILTNMPPHRFIRIAITRHVCDNVNAPQTQRFGSVPEFANLRIEVL